MNIEPNGKIITFYSYKGGSSRSMALANVAWILASNGKRVLTVDWDLEAPGLHKYFAPFLLDKELTSSPGIIDLVWDFVNQATKPSEMESDSASTDHEKDWYQPLTNIKPFAIRLNWTFPNEGTLDFIPAGRQGSSYAKRVNFFNWENFYDRFGGGVFLEAVKQEMQKHYDYIFIDSRTGVSDTSGICTVQLPDILVLIFTPNNQNIEGAFSVAESVSKQWNAQEQWKNKRLIYPVLTRTERAESDKLDLARQYVRAKFQDLLSNMSQKRREDYWSNVEIPYIPWYAYEEVLATFRDQPNTRDSLLSSYQQLTRFLTNGEISNLIPLDPSLREAVLNKFARMKRLSSDIVDDKSVFVAGTNNVIYNYTVVDANIEKQEPDYWALKHPYPMPPNFTGRIAERVILTHWLKEDSENRLFILRALGGFGKSALTWHWLTHDVDIKEYPKVVFWSFYEGDASFEHFIEETLKYLKLEIPQGQRPQVDELLKAMQGEKILLIMDGFERALRAYSSMNAAYQGDEPKVEDNQLDCVNLNAEIFLKGVCSLPNIKSKVLMTTRLTPRAVKPRGESTFGCREVELTAMQPSDAVEFFRKQGIKGTHAEIETACAQYGYHPLSLRLLAGRILKDFENPADIVVAQKLKIDGDIIQQKHHVLEVSYNSLPPGEQKLLSTIACFRSPVPLDTLVTITKPIKEEQQGLFGFFKKKTSSVYAGNINTDLKDLVERGLLHLEEKNNKFDLHPVVRRFAYDRLTNPQRTDAHSILVVYFEAVPQPQKIDKLEDLAPVIELYHHMVRGGNLDEGLELFYDRINKIAYYQFGAYQLQIELLRALFPNGEDKPPRLKKEADQAWTLNALANSYSLSGQPHRAVPLIETHNALQEKVGAKKNLAIGLGNLAGQQLVIGALSQAERNLLYSIDLCRKIDDEHYEVINHQEIGRVLSYRGEWNSSEEELETAAKLLEKQSGSIGNSLILGDKVPDSALYSLQPVVSGSASRKPPKSQRNNDQSLSALWSYRAFCFILIARANSETKLSYLKSSIQYASRSLELAQKWARTQYPIPRDFVRAYWLLGAAYYANNELTLAEENLSKALDLCRQINLVESESDILLYLARLRYNQKNYEEAKSLADEALLITERCGYVLQGADVNLFLAQYALEQEKDKAKAKAKQYAEEAKKLATCDGPPYYYKVAYEEAEAMLKMMKAEG